MDEPALRVLIDRLDAAQASQHWWLEFFTALVVVGVALEVAFVVVEFFEGLHDFRRGIVHAPDRPSVWLMAFSLFGASLVAVGVAGELREESKIEAVETQKRKANDELYLLLSKEAADARESARDAAFAARTAREEADGLIGEVAKLSPRNLSWDQQRKIADALKPFSGRQVEFDSYGMDGEGTALATQLIALASRGARLSVIDGRANLIVSGGFEWGVAIRGPESEMPFMLALQKALISIGSLKQVVINGPQPQLGGAITGETAISGGTMMMGGGRPSLQKPAPSTGPVRVMVGIKPPDAFQKSRR